MNLLVALNQEAYDLHYQELEPDGIAVMDASEKPAADKALLVSFVDLAKQAGGKIFAKVRISLIKIFMRLIWVTKRLKALPLNGPSNGNRRLPRVR